MNFNIRLTGTPDAVRDEFRVRSDELWNRMREAEQHAAIAELVALRSIALQRLDELTLTEEYNGVHLEIDAHREEMWPKPGEHGAPVFHAGRLSVTVHRMRLTLKKELPR